MKLGQTKFNGSDIVRLNSVGLSLATIAKVLRCHPSTVTTRLNDIGIQAADTRRAFMEDVFTSLTPEQQEWLADQLSAEHTIKTFVKELIVDAYKKRI